MFRSSLPIPETKMREFLDALPLVGLGDEEIAAGIDGEIVRAVELSSPVAGAAERADHCERLPIEHVDLLVGAVGHDQELLLRVGREADVPHRSAAERLLRNEDFTHEGSVLVEDLDAIVGA